MTKQKFAELLLSRFMNLGLDARFVLIESLILAENDLVKKDLKNVQRLEDLIDFVDWSQNISEILFQEDFVFQDGA